jgi:hypothetical protein
MFGGVAPVSAAQVSVKVVAVVIGPDTVPAGPDEAPENESPFVPVTVQLPTFFMFQYRWVVSPERTKTG